MTQSNFGYDTSCVTGLRTGRFAFGPRLVAEAAYRRVTTPRGTLRGGDAEQNYGIDLADEIGSVTDPATAASLPGRVESELLKDERIESVEVTVTPTVDGPSTSYKVSIEGNLVNDGGTFSLVLSVNDVTVDLLNISAG